MQFQIPHLKLGQEVQAEVREIFADGDALVSFNGDLLRIHNHTSQKLAVGETITLRVTALDPLAFRWKSQAAQGRGLDVTV